MGHASCCAGWGIGHHGPAFVAWIGGKANPPSAALGEARAAREQFFVLPLECERAIDVLGSLVPEAKARTELLKQVAAIVGADEPPSAAALPDCRRC
ncbi:MAG: hypothetical protein ACREFP_26760 [Acetobacteraceae bacterium]